MLVGLWGGSQPARWCLVSMCCVMVGGGCFILSAYIGVCRKEVSAHLFCLPVISSIHRPPVRTRDVLTGLVQ